MTVFLLCGSIAEKSHTNALLNYLGQLFSEKDHQVIFWDLKTQPLPIALPQYHKDPLQHPFHVVKEFVTLIDQSDVVILGTPLYHGSYSGVLKNALDNLKKDAFRDKKVGFVGNASSRDADMVAFSHLRHVVNTLYGYSLQTMIKTGKEDYQEETDRYVLISDSIQQRCQRLVNEVLEGKTQ